MGEWLWRVQGVEGVLSLCLAYVCYSGTNMKQGSSCCLQDVTHKTDFKYHSVLTTLSEHADVPSLIRHVAIYEAQFETSMSLN